MDEMMTNTTTTTAPTQIVGSNVNFKLRYQFSYEVAELKNTYESYMFNRKSIVEMAKDEYMGRKVYGMGAMHISQQAHVNIFLRGKDELDANKSYTTKTLGDMYVVQMTKLDLMYREMFLLLRDESFTV
jgi:tryptophan synthase beta subunit